ncbi:MAG TPA: aldo/keto reductase [Gemmatimonadales bacterium]|jgi:aryl-alcohol dehydrogenase-like predicted oxidoreductase
MHTRPLGPGAPEVSCIGFGGMPLSITGRPDEGTAIATLHAVLDGGVTLLDTADVYCENEHDIGHNERLIAKALASWKGDRTRIIVATKGGMTRSGGGWQRNAHPTHLRAACDRSLKALGIDRIDLYQLHAPDPAIPFLETVGVLAELQRAGKIRWVGLSNVSVEEIQEAMNVVPIVTVQNRLNPFFREALREGVVRFCEREDIGFLAYSPVGGGRLNKKLPAHPALLPIAERHGVSPHAVVIAWVMAQGQTVIPIPAGRGTAHALDALTAAKIVLDADELSAIDRAEFSRA